MERFRTQAVSLAEIDSDDQRYAVTTAGGCEDLIESINVVGLVQPPVLLETAARWIVVAGRRRIAACTQIGLTQVLARKLPAETPSRIAALVAVADNSLQRSLNLIETSRALRLLMREVSDQDEFNTICRTLHLPHQNHLIQKIVPLGDLSPKIQTYVVSGHISLAMAEALGRLEDKDWALELAELFYGLNLSLNKQREILTLTSEIARREKLRPQEVLAASACQAILHDAERDANQKSRQLRDYLRRQRFPHIHQAEETFEKHRRQLPLGPTVKLTPPANFESADFTLKLQFRTTAELKDQIEQLQELVGHPHLKAILDKI